MESLPEPLTEKASLYTRQSSGIRALPSHDDDDDINEFDDEFYVENDIKINKINENMKNSVTTSSNESSNSSISSSFANNGSYVNEEEDFVTPLAGPDSQTIGKFSGVDGIEGLGSPGVRGARSGFPVAKVSDDRDDDEGEIEGDSEEEEVGDGVENAPRVTVLDEDEEEDEAFEEAKEELGDDGEVRVEGSKVEENGSDIRGVEMNDEGDTVVDSINVDVVEAMRSGIAVVGMGEEKPDSKVEIVDAVVGAGEEEDPKVEFVDAVEEDKEEKVGSEFEVGMEETSVEEPAVVHAVSVKEGCGVKLTDEGDFVVDSIKVDAGEAVRSGVAVVGEVEERKDYGELEPKGGNTVVEESTVTVEDSVTEETDEVDSKYVEADEARVTDEVDSVVDKVNVDIVEASSGMAVVGDSGVAGTKTEVKERNDSGIAGAEVEFSAVEDSASTVEDSVAEEPVEIDEEKITWEEDSVVDKVNVDVEAMRPGVAVDGDYGAAKTESKMEVKEETTPVGEKVTLANEFEPLVLANQSEIVDVSEEQHKEGPANEEVTPALVEIDELQNPEAINPVADETKQHESADGIQVVSGGEQENVLDDNVQAAASDQINEQIETSSPEEGDEAEERFHVPQEEHDDEGSDGESEPQFFKSEISSRDFMEELVSGNRSEMIDGQVVTDSEEEADSDEEGEGRELIDSAALAALLKAATSAGSDGGPITITSQDGSRLFSVERPAGLGTSLRSVRPTSNASNSNFFAPPSVAAPSEESLSEEDKKKLQKIHELRVKFLRLVQRLGQTVDQSVSSQVLYKLAILAGRTPVPSFTLDNAKQTAMQLEAEGKDDLDFSLNLLVLGKSGVGKSATINSIFGEEKLKINAFEPETSSVNEVSGIVDGVKIRVIDAPGLRSSALEQGFNRKVLGSVKKIIKKYPPDLTLYVDRLDSQTRDLNDLPMLRTITNSLGASIWRSTILTLTHAACAPPDGPAGTPIGYEVFVGQRSHVIQQSIGQAVGDLRFMNLGMMNPVSLVENHPACRKNREGLKVLPNGQAWRPQLMLLCYSLKILADATLTTKPQDPVDQRKLFNFRVRAPPLPYLLSSLLQPRTHPKLSADQGGDNGDSDIDLDDLSDSDQEEEDEYDQLPPFKPLRKSQIAKLSREQKKAYFEEYDYRVKLLQRKQWREELKRVRDMKNSKTSLDEFSEMPEDYDGAPAAVPVPLPDMVLPPSFDSDTPAYRYRFLEPTSQFLARPVLDTHGWDHDCGYDGVNVEQNLGIAGRFPAAVTVQVTKDKKDFNIHVDSAVSAKHGENGSSLVGFDIQTIGKQLAYIVRGESKFKNLKKNKTAAGVSVTFLGENVATGVKLEDQIALGKRLVLVGSTGTVRSQKDAAYGANLEVRLREADYPIGQDQSSFVLSLMKWRGDLAIGANLQSQISVGRGTKTAVRVALNNKQSGQITVRTSSSDHVALAYAGLIPIALAIYQKFRPNASENYSVY